MITYNVYKTQPNTGKPDEKIGTINAYSTGHAVWLFAGTPKDTGFFTIDHKPVQWFQCDSGTYYAIRVKKPKH